MTIRKFILFILTLSIYGLLIENSSADNRKHCIPKITSSSAREINGQPHKMVISGSCLEKVTHVTLAKDDGDGFESLQFTKESNPKLKTDLVFVVPKRAEGKASSIQPPRYLLQIHVCKDKVMTENCKTHEPTIFITKVSEFKNRFNILINI